MKVGKSNTKPRVVIDARMVGPILHGIARYVLQLAYGLEKVYEESELSYEPIFLVSPSHTGALKIPFQTQEVKSEFLSPTENFDIPKVLKSLQADLYHSPSFSSLWSCPCPSLVTIHDLNHLTYGSLPQKLYYQVLLRRFARKSRLLLTVSQFSQHELAEWLNIPRNQIEIAYNTLSQSHLKTPEPQLTQEVLKKYNLIPFEYFFSLSNPKPHKNLNLLCAAYRDFKTQQPLGWPLVLSAPGFEGEEGIRSLGGLSNQEAEILLSQSAGLFFPSLYEGFGLPPIEGAALRVPLIISKIPPHQEGLQDLAPEEVCWVSPVDQPGWTAAFHRAFKREVRPPSPENQQKILNRFHPETLGRRMDQIYRSMLLTGR